jgi:hypothetical protein
LHEVGDKLEPQLGRPFAAQSFAYLYVRQSSLRQVFKNRESKKRQYALRQHAMCFRQPDQIVVINGSVANRQNESDRLGRSCDGNRIRAVVFLDPAIGLCRHLARISKEWLEDVHAFSIANTQESGFSHILIGPVVGAMFGGFASIIARFQHKRQPSAA